VRKALCAVAVILAACSPPTRWVAVAGGDGTILLFNGDLVRADTLRPRVGGEEPESIALISFGLDGTSLYSVGTRGSITLLRKQDGYPLEHTNELGNGPANSLITLPNARTLMATTPSRGGSAGTLSFLDARTLRRETTLQPCPDYAQGIAILRDLNRAYTRCMGNRTEVADIDLDLRRVITTEPVRRADSSGSSDRSCGTGGIALSRTGTVLLVPCSSSGMLLYIDRLKLSPFDSVAVGPGAYRVAASPTESKAIVTYPDSRRVAFVDLRNRRVTTEITAPGTPVDVAIGGDGRRAYILTSGTQQTAGDLMLLDMDSERVVSEVAVPPGSRSLSLWPGRWSPVMRWD
jgi:DNA-binding beta-propeller fold protein YncE